MEKKKFRFPKGVRQMNFPAMPPLGFEELATQQIQKEVSRFSALPKNARVRFEYRYPDNLCAVQIYKSAHP